MYLKKQRLDGQTAFITGAARGIGFHTAEALAEAGAKVIISGPEEEPLGEAIEMLAAKGYTAQEHGARRHTFRGLHRGRRARQSQNKMKALLISLLPMPALPGKTPRRAEDLDDAAWLSVIDVNLNGAFWSCRAFGRFMLERKRGAIVTVGSMSGFVSNKPQNQVHYNASKAGLHHLTKSLAGEWADRGVRVNAVAPTYVNTVMSNITAKQPEYFDHWMEGTPMKRMIEPEEVASVNLFLASDASSGMTGAVVLVDAGYTIW